MRKASRKASRKGMILRSAYTRKTKSGKTVKVPAGMIKNVGLPGKGYKGTNGPGIGELHSGDLTKFGYENVAHLTSDERHKALKKAVEEYGALDVMRKLVAVSTYSKHTAPKSSKIFKSDASWVKNIFMK
jgi:hypothetical protein